MNDDSTQIKKNKKNKSLIFALIGWGIIVFLIIIGVLASNFGFLNISIKSNKEAVVVRSDVCKSDYIDKYNSLLIEEDPEIYYAGIDSLAKDIEALPNYESDSNCVFMLAKYYMIKEDVPNSQKFVDILKSNNSKGNYASGYLDDLTNMDTVEWNLVLLVEQGMGQDKFKDNAAG
jgi:hypothetical protein